MRNISVLFSNGLDKGFESFRKNNKACVRVCKGVRKCAEKIIPHTEITSVARTQKALTMWFARLHAV